MQKISVIIPVYNVEKYIGQCLDSVISQTYTNLEIICVNDCSPDNSLAVLTEYTKKDSRIKVINREKNGGASATRNTGMTQASGEYIYFLDSDDWIEPDYLEKMVDAMEKSDATVVLNTKILAHQEGKEPSQFLPLYAKENIKDTFLKTEDCIFSIIWNVWAYLWKKSFLDKIHAQFPEGYACVEDMYFHATTLVHLKEIYVIRESNYHYRVRKESVTDEFKDSDNSKVGDAQLKITELIYDYYKSNNMLDNLRSKMLCTPPLPHVIELKHMEYLKKLKEYIQKISGLIEKNKDKYSDLDLFLYKYIKSVDFSQKIGINLEKDFIFFMVKNKRKHNE